MRQNSKEKFGKTQKLKLWQNSISNCDKTQNSDSNKTKKKSKWWQKYKTQIVTKLKNLSCKKKLIKSNVDKTKNQNCEEEKTIYEEKNF